MKIVVDAMGGDHAPQAIVAGVVDAVNESDVINITLVGIEDQVREELKKYKFPQEKIEVIHAPEVVGMNEPASTPVRRKRESSIAIGINLLKEKQYDAFVSAGNTAAVVGAATIFLGMLEGVDRPAIGIGLPTLKGKAFLIDVGANTEAKPQHLLQSAQMANVYAREVLGIEYPTTGLLNIGEEAGKGSGFEKETYKMMEEKLTNFIGNLEANEVFTGKATCIICDGFVGNIVIKVAEGLMESAGKLLKREVMKNPFSIFAAGIFKMTLKEFKKLVDYSEYGGAPLLGVNGLVMISHGRSSPKAIRNAIRATKREVEHNIIEKMIKDIKSNG
ncbi:MAG TPA: phosphate acyltransferase PlsX [Candidatus Omnitrophota bacterium]|nr:phosphate acyltransferase PlsX [Candidatus Omnitrophota bacterium]